MDMFRREKEQVPDTHEGVVELARASFERGELNEYFYNQISNRMHVLPDELYSYYLEAKDMSALDIDNKDHQKVYFYITEHVSDLALTIVKEPSNQVIESISAELFSNMQYDEEGNVKYFSTIVDFMAAIVAVAKKLNIPVIDRYADEDRNNIVSLAYPQGFSGAGHKEPYNVSKWMKATRDIYSRAKVSGDLNAEFQDATSQWDKMETLDYKYFLKFYQEGAHEKYKIAEADATPGYYLPEDLRATISMPDMPEPPQPERSERDIIETQRHRIISRLNSAEKLLASLDGGVLAGEDQEYMLQLLQDLKRKVQIANKVRIRSSLFEDYIYRTANMLENDGQKEAATFFYKIAQADKLDMGAGPGAPPGDAPAAPGAPPPGDDPMADLGLGDMGGDPAAGGPMAGGPSDGKDMTETAKAFHAFYNRLEHLVDDEYGEEDNLAVIESPFSKSAQMDPMPEPGLEPRRPAPGRPAPKAKPEALVDPRMQKGKRPNEDGGIQVTEEKYRDPIDDALKGVTVSDVIIRLERLSNMLRKREIPRELAKVDIELDELNLGSYFPGLGEAERSALESNQYMATRIDDVLSKLRGSLAADSTETMLEVEENEREDTKDIQQALEQGEEKDKQRKENRRKKQDLKDDGGAPEEAAPAAAPVGAEAPEELKQPADIEKGKPVQVR